MSEESLKNELARLRLRVAELESLASERFAREFGHDNERYKIIFENTGTAIALLEADHTVTLVNDEFCRLSGYSKEEVEGNKKWTEFIAEEYLPRMVEYNKQRRINPEGVPNSYDMVYINKPGELRRASVSVTVIPETNQSLVSLLDITEQRQAEECKEWSQEILHILNQNAELQETVRGVVNVFKTKADFDAVGIRLQDGVDFPYCYQEGFSESFLRTENTLVGRGVEGIAGLDRSGEGNLECTCGLVISGKNDPDNPFLTRGGSAWTNDSFPLLDTPADAENRFNPRNICIHQGYASIALIPIRQRDKIIGLIQLNDQRKGRFSLTTIEYLEEIANQLGLSLMHKQAEKALLESEQNFRTFAEEFTQGIMITEKDTMRITYANRSLLALFDTKSLDDFVSSSYHQRYTEDSVALIEERMKRDENNLENPDEYSLQVKKGDGSVHQVLVSNRDIKWSNESQRLTIFVDVTDQRHLEEQLRHSQVLASLGEMTAGIAHEVGNPLASIVLYAEVAMNGVDVSRQVKNDLKVIHNEAKRAGKLMKDLLAYSRKLEPNMHQMDVGSVINKVIPMLQYQLGVQNIAIVDDRLKSPLEVNGDDAQLTQVFMNLVMNAGEALKAKDGGVITISSASEEEYVKVVVKDDGPGIPAAYIDQIFMPFFTTKKVGEGTGLGLSLCFGIIMAHGGTITADNNRNGGASFTVRLPRLQPE